MSTAAIVAGGIASAGIGAGASLSAAGTQADAAKSAAQLQHQDQQASLAFQQKQFDTTQANEAPWIKAGQGAVTSLSDLLHGGLPNWSNTFQAPTGANEQNDPGYQFRLEQGQKALENSAAARGGALSGGTGQALQQYGQDYASNEYGNVYNRALQQYQQNYNIYQNNQANQFNRTATLAGLGQTSTAQLGQFGQQAANNVANINTTSGAQIGQQLNNQAAATASGYVGAGNAASSGINSIGQYLSLQQLLNGGQFGGTSGTFAVNPYAGNPNTANQQFIGGLNTSAPLPGLSG